MVTQVLFHSLKPQVVCSHGEGIYSNVHIVTFKINLIVHKNFYPALGRDMQRLMIHRSVGNQYSNKLTS